MDLQYRNLKDAENQTNSARDHHVLFSSHIPCYEDLSKLVQRNELQLSTSCRQLSMQYKYFRQCPIWLEMLYPARQHFDLRKQMDLCNHYQ